MSVSKYFIDFIVYSFIGWIWESIYCTIDQKEWQDRGFLFGPICPIYGSCVVIAEIAFSKIGIISSPDLPWYVVFLISMIGSAIAEYGTSFVLEKRFHARWWDYSNMPLNLNGRICLPASTGFGVAGVVFVKLVFPAMESMQASVALPLAVLESVAIIFALLLGADLALTEASLSSLLKSVEDYKEEMNIRAEITYENLVDAPKKFQENMATAKERLAEEIAAAPKKLEEGIAAAPRKLEEGIAAAPKKLEETWAAGSRRLRSSEERQPKERLASRYVSKLDFNQRRILNSVKKFTPYKKDAESAANNSRPDHVTAMESFRSALKRNKKEKQNKEQQDSQKSA